MNQINKFFDNKNVRISVDNNNDIWFNGKDICQCLGISNHNNMFQKLDQEEKMIYSTKDSMGRYQDMIYINESGVYEVLFRSKHGKAKEFKKWLKNDVLPSIRQTGQFVMKDKKYYEEKIKKIQIDMYKDAYKFFDDLGDERYKSICLDNVKNVMSPLNTPLIEDKTRLISISERIYNDLQRKLNKNQHNQLITLGKLIKSYYYNLNGEDPIKCLKLCNGHQTRVFCYKLSDYEEWIDNQINIFFNF